VNGMSGAGQRRTPGGPSRRGAGTGTEGANGTEAKAQDGTPAGTQDGTPAGNQDGTEAATQAATASGARPGTTGGSGARSSGDPSVHQLRLFLVLAEELHFGRAARRVFTSQPAFSRQIKALERRLRVGLVARSTREVQLTPAGQALLPEAQAVVDSVDRLGRVAALHTREVSGELTIGAIAAEAAMPYAQAILAELRVRHPGLRVEIRSLDFVNQAGALTGGEVDAAFLRPPVPAEFQTLRLAIEPRVVCVRADDPLVEQQPLKLAQLADRTVLDVPPVVPRGWWDEWTVNPRPDGTPVRYGPVVTDIEPMLLAVARGEGITFLPAAARRLYPRPGIAYVDVTDLPLSTAALAWPAEHRDRPAVVALREIAARVVARGCGDGASAQP
jgi:DNA-binding transcriptional LysR family regulator